VNGGKSGKGKTKKKLKRKKAGEKKIKELERIGKIYEEREGGSKVEARRRLRLDDIQELFI